MERTLPIRPRRLQMSPSQSFFLLSMRDRSPVIFCLSADDFYVRINRACYRDCATTTAASTNGHDNDDCIHA